MLIAGRRCNDLPQWRTAGRHCSLLELLAGPSCKHDGVLMFMMVKMSSGHLETLETAPFVFTFLQ